MPLHDHFHPPLSKQKNWEGFHGLWPGLITVQLNQMLPTRFEAEPSVHVGAAIEVDVATLESPGTSDWNHTTSGDLAVALSTPSLAIETDTPTESEYEIRVFDLARNRRLVAAIELVSPSNKDRPESRQVFVSKCRALLRSGVSVTIVDIVTARRFNLYAELLEFVGQVDPTFGPEPPGLYAAACRWIPRGRRHLLETWSYTLQLDQPLPTVPLWLAENFAVPLDLEASYAQTCQALRITN